MTFSFRFSNFLTVDVCLCCVCTHTQQRVKWSRHDKPSPWAIEIAPPHIFHTHKKSYAFGIGSSSSHPNTFLTDWLCVSISHTSQSRFTHHGEWIPTLLHINASLCEVPRCIEWLDSYQGTIWWFNAKSSHAFKHFYTTMKTCRLAPHWKCVSGEPATSPNNKSKVL